jgi:hypothetical protein
MEVPEFTIVSVLDSRYETLRNTLVCSYSRVEDFEYYISRIPPFWGHLNLVANSSISDDTVYHVNHEGIAIRYRIPEELA